MRALRYLAGAFAGLAATLAGLLLVTFVIGRVMPIDPVVAAVGDKASAPGQVAIEDLRIVVDILRRSLAAK